MIIRHRTTGAIVATSVVLALMLLGGCSSTDVTTEGTEGGTPLVQVVDPPDAPPVIELVGVAAEHVQQGLIFNGSWRSGQQVVDLSTDGDIALWPAVSRWQGVTEVGIRLPSHGLPSIITVQVYDDRLRQDGSPQGAAVFILDCAMADMMGTSDCGLVSSDNYFMLGGVQLSASGPSRIAVNIHWPDPNADFSSGERTVWATWLFAVDGSAS